MQKNSLKSFPRVFTLPDCPNCSKLKEWLDTRKVKFEESLFDTEAQVDFIMRNVFGNPPILDVGSKAMSSEDLFVDGMLDEEKAWEVLKSEKA